MRFDYPARNERMLARHPDIEAVNAQRGLVFLRRNEVLAVQSDATVVADRGRRWIDGHDDHPSGIVRFRLRPAAKVDVAEWTATLAGGAHKRIGIGPNHVCLAQPQWHPGPADDPEPIDPLPAPPPAGPYPAGPTPRVAILDTGIVPHPWFLSCPWFATCLPPDYEVLDANLDFQLDSLAGHGTFIAGIFRKYAPTAELVIRRVIESDGVTDEFRLIHALHALPRVDVISLSLGCYTYDDKPPPALAHVLARIPRDVVIVACAGNCSSDRPFWPAAMKRVIGVGALNAAGSDRADFSNYGWWVDACAVGEGVTSTFVTFNGPQRPSGDYDPDRFVGYARWSGTSFAAPRFAAAIAARVTAKSEPASHAADALLDPTGRRSFPDLGVALDDAPGTTP